MTSLDQRKTKLTFTTASTIRHRAVVIEAAPYYAVVRLKGKRTRYVVPWDAIHDLGARLKVEADRREKQAARKAKKAGKYAG